MTSHTVPPLPTALPPPLPTPPSPLPTPPLPPPSSLLTPHSSQSHPFQQNPPYKKGKNSWDCEVCKKHFTRSNDLRDHKINVHKMDIPFICLTCSRTYTNKRNLNQHIENKHENTYKYTCFKTQKSGKRCKLQTNSKDVYTTHNVMYHGEAPSGDFTCPKCQKRSFVQTSKILNV